LIKLTTNLPDGWTLTPLGELCDINPPKPRNFQREDDDATSFIPMEAVDETTGAVVAAQIRPYRSVARGYTYFQNGDIILAKITPCMQNGKAAIVSNLRDGVGFGSTEFHVLRPKTGVDARWIYYLVRSAEFRRKAEDNFEGSAGQRRVPENFLRELCVPFPKDESSSTHLLDALEPQLARLQQMRQAAVRQIDASSAITQSFSRLVFPFSGLNDLPEGWTIMPLRALRESIEYGLSRAATSNQIGPKFLRITDIQEGEVNWESVPFCACTEAESAARKLDDGDIIFARTGATTGKSYLIKDPPNAVFASYLIRVKCNKNRVLPEYLYTFFQSPIYRNIIGKKARGGAQAGFNATMLDNLSIPLPRTHDDQEKIADEFRERASQARRVKRACERQLEAITALPLATLRQFFNFTTNGHA
jgi:type I restriction enzyme S subunit